MQSQLQLHAGSKNLIEAGNYRIRLDQTIGYGMYSNACLAYRNNDPSRVCAAKIIPKTRFQGSPKIKELIEREIEILKRIEGPHFVQMLDVLQTTNNLYIFLELCEDGSVQDALEKNGPYDEPQALNIVKQIAHAFLSLENANPINQGKEVPIIHRDLKPTNILLHKGSVKIAYFGLSRIIADDDGYAKQEYIPLGCPLYSSPQVLEDEIISAKCDIYSLGVVLYKMIFGVTPWIGPERKLYDIIKEKSLEFPGSIRESTKDLIKRMLAFEEEDRLTWNEVYEHPALCDV